MLKEFVNNEMSADEVDTMMEDFFKQKEEKEFRKKWNKILDDKEPKYKIVRFFRKHMYATVSAASILLLIGIGGLYYNTRYLNQNVNYTDVIKGNSTMKTKLSNLTNKQVVSISNNASNETKSVWEMYKSNHFEKVISEVDKNIKSNKNFSNEMIWMAGLSSIKIEDYTKARDYLSRIGKDAPYFKDSRELLKILNDILE